MNYSELLLEQYQKDAWVIEQQAKDLTNQESLIQLPFRSNCFNWVMGHIVVHRDKALEALGENPTLSPDESDVYRRGSDPILDEESAIPLSRLIEAFNKSQEILLGRLANTPEENLGKIWDQENEISIGGRLIFLQWHEAYHIGQLEILRQLAGKDDAIIS
ncbi:MAG: DinB family protein [Chloroflexota bacterium]